MNFRQMKQLPPAQWMANLVLYFIAVSIMPAGAVLTINAHLGAGGYDALNFALGQRLHVNTSIAIYITAFVILLLAAFARKSYPRIETFISSFFLGIFTDLWKGILSPFEGTTLLSGIVMLLIGIIIVAFTVACYMVSIFPTNPTDDFVVALHERGIKISVAKISLDAACVLLAFLLGGEVGAGTIICTFGLGPVIDFFHAGIHKFLPDVCKTP